MNDIREAKCERCDEAVEQEVPDFVSRLTGTVIVRTYTIRFTSWITRPLALMRNREDGIRSSYSEMTLCSECWGALLSWCAQPEQERLRIAAENRSAIERKRRYAEERREREIEALMSEGGDR